MRTKIRVNIKLILFSIALLIAAFFVYLYWPIVKVFIRQFLESRITYFFAWTVPILIFIINFIGVRLKDIESEPIITKRFGVFCDRALGGIAFAVALVTALTLLKGLFVQTFFNDRVFFLDFNSVDLLTILSAALFLLYVCIRKVIEMAKDTYLVSQTAIVLNEQKVEVKFKK